MHGGANFRGSVAVGPAFEHRVEGFANRVLQEVAKPDDDYEVRGRGNEPANGGYCQQRNRQPGDAAASFEPTLGCGVDPNAAQSRHEEQDADGQQRLAARVEVVDSDVVEKVHPSKPVEYCRAEEQQQHDSDKHPQARPVANDRNAFAQGFAKPHASVFAGREVIFGHRHGHPSSEEGVDDADENANELHREPPANSDRQRPDQQRHHHPPPMALEEQPLDGVVDRVFVGGSVFARAVAFGSSSAGDFVADPGRVCARAERPRKAQQCLGGKHHPEVRASERPNEAQPHECLGDDQRGASGANVGDDAGWCLRQQHCHFEHDAQQDQPAGREVHVDDPKDRQCKPQAPFQAFS